MFDSVFPVARTAGKSTNLEGLCEIVDEVCASVGGNFHQFFEMTLSSLCSCVLIELNISYLFLRYDRHRICGHIQAEVSLCSCYPCLMVASGNIFVSFSLVMHQLSCGPYQN